MAYDHTQTSVTLATAASIASAANVGAAVPFAVRTLIRRVVVTITTDTTVASSVITLYRRITAGSDTGRVAIGTVTVPVASAGNAYVLQVINDSDRKIGLGEEIIAASDGGATAGAANITALVEPSWESALTDTDATVVTS